MSETITVTVTAERATAATNVKTYGGRVVAHATDYILSTEDGALVGVVSTDAYKDLSSRVVFSKSKPTPPGDAKESAPRTASKAKK